MRAEIRRKELLEKKLAGEVEEEELEGQLGQEEAKIDETEEAGARLVHCWGDACGREAWGLGRFRLRWWDGRR